MKIFYDMIKTMKTIKPQTLKGFRDFLPKEMVIRQKVIDTLKKVFESYGFEPLETPALEYAETLLGKYGPDADRLVYTFTDRGGRQVGLRYDLTVPASRVLAQYADKIPLPFKRYQIQSVWRAEKPQKGRYREFTQCDADIFGTASPLADAEIIALIYNCLKAVKFENFIIRINSRQVIFSLLKNLGITNQQEQLKMTRIIDKLDKIGRQKVAEELKEPEKLFALLQKAKPDENLKKVLDYLPKLGIEAKYFKFDPTLVRGLDYYTGPIFETIVEKPKNLPDRSAGGPADEQIGSLGGGGRYDNLVATLGGPNLPATGYSFGLDRICEVIQKQNLWPEISATSTKVLVTIFSADLLEKSLELASLLRDKGINTELYPEAEDKLDKQIKYADKKGIPYVLILGPEEVEKKMITLKSLRTGRQTTVPPEKIISYLP